MTKDLEDELWKIYDRIESDDLDKTALKLKAIELVTRIRGSTSKGKADSQPRDGSLQRAMDRVNGQKP